MNIQAFLDSLPIMLKGMGGIFIVIAVIYVAILLLLRIPQKKDGEDK